jgi:hypothetical protein
LYFQHKFFRKPITSPGEKAENLLSLVNMMQLTLNGQMYTIQYPLFTVPAPSVLSTPIPPTEVGVHTPSHLSAQTDLLQLDVRPLHKKACTLEVKKNYAITSEGVCVCKEIFVVNGLPFTPGGTMNEWNLSDCGDFSFLCKDRRVQFLGNLTNLPNALVLLLLDLAPDTFVVKGDQFVLPSGPNLDLLVGSMTIRKHIQDALIRCMGSKMTCSEVNSSSGELEILPLSDLTFTICQFFAHVASWDLDKGKKYGFSSSRVSPEYPDVLYDSETKFSLWTIDSICFTYHGKRDTYHFVDLNGAKVQQKNAILTFKEKSGNWKQIFNSVRFGGADFATIGGMVYKFPDGDHWHWYK